MIGFRRVIASTWCIAFLLAAGCHHHEEKTTRKITIEGPQKKTEVKIETTEKDKPDD